MNWTKDEICEDKFGTIKWAATSEEEKKAIRSAMQEWGKDVAIEYAHWLLERIFSQLMERPDREGHKLFAAYQKEKTKP